MKIYLVQYLWHSNICVPSLISNRPEDGFFKKCRNISLIITVLYTSVL